MFCKRNMKKAARLKKWQPKRLTTDCLQYSQRKKRHRPMPYSYSPLVWDTSSFSIHLFKSNMSMGTQKPSEGVKSPGAGVTGDCEPLDTGSRNQTSVLIKCT